MSVCLKIICPCEETCSKAIKAVSLSGTHMHMLGRCFLQRRQLSCWVRCGVGGFVWSVVLFERRRGCFTWVWGGGVVLLPSAYKFLHYLVAAPIEVIMQDRAIM